MKSCICFQDFRIQTSICSQESHEFTIEIRSELGNLPRGVPLAAISTKRRKAPTETTPGRSSQERWVFHMCLFCHIRSWSFLWYHHSSYFTDWRLKHTCYIMYIYICVILVVSYHLTSYNHSSYWLDILLLLYLSSRKYNGNIYMYIFYDPFWIIS